MCGTIYCCHRTTEVDELSCQCTAEHLQLYGKQYMIQYSIYNMIYIVYNIYYVYPGHNSSVTLRYHTVYIALSIDLF